MKQYIKKALWIIPFVFSLNLSAATYYFRSSSSTKNFWTRTNWSTTSTGAGLSASGTSIANLLASNTWDLNGQSNVDMAGGTILANFTLINGSGTNASLKNTGVLSIYATNNPFTASNITFDFSTTGSTIKMLQSAASQPIFPFTYFNLEINENSKVISSGATNAVTINGEFFVKTVLSIQGSLNLGSGATMKGASGTTYGPVIEWSTGATISDGRSTVNKLFPVNFKHYVNSDVLPGTYNTLQILENASLGGNIIVNDLLKIGNSTSAAYKLDIKSFKITLNGSLDCPFNSTLGEYNRIDASLGTFEYANASTSLDWDPENFGSSTQNATSSLVDVKNLIISAANTSSSVTGINFYSKTIITGDLTINSGVSYLFDSELQVNNKLIIASDYPDWILPDINSTTHAIDLTGANSELKVQSKQSTLTHDFNIFKSNKINKLTLDFTNGGEFVLNNDLEIISILDLSSTTGNILNLNDKTLTVNNISNINGSSGGQFLGSNSSSLICSTANVGTIYFDQSSTSSYTLQNLTLANGASCTLGSNLILANGVDLGTSNLTVGSNTLTFAGSAATWITRNGGRVNTTGGTIEYAQTSTAGTNHSIDLSAYYTSTAGVPLNNFTVNFANACSFTPPTATDMTIGGTLNLSGSKNTFVINGGTTLTVLGNVSSTGGKFKGSATSNLNCYGTSSLYFDQTNASTKTLKNLKIQGMSADVTLKSELNITGGSNYGSIEVTAASNKFSTGDALTLKSDANGTARIANSPGTISGNYYAEQYFPANREYRFICAPVVGATALQWRNNGSTTNHTGLGISITGANPSSNSFDASTANKPSAFWYDETIAGSVTNVNSTGTDDPGWTSISNGNSYGLTNGKGFRVLVRGDRDISLSSSSPSPSTTTITSYGTYPRTSGSSVVLNVTNTNRTSETNNGLNLVGNPFPSAIDWNSITLSNVDNGYATYDPVGHKYVAWNGSLGDATRYISSGQAFFVMCTNSGTGTLTIEEADKYDGKGGNFFLENLSNHMRINLMYDSTYNSDAFIHFRDDASDVKDVYDIQQFYVNGTNIASLDKNGKPYKINSLKTLDSLTVVPLSIAGTPEASLKLSFYDIPSFYGYKLELVDTYLKKTVEITEGMIYNLDITSDSFTVKDGRFYINIAKIPGLKNRSFESNKIANIYPNPIQDKMAIRLDKKITQANYEIFNSIGQLVTMGNIESPESTINTSSYSNGTYYLIVKTNNSSQTIQFVK